MIYMDTESIGFYGPTVLIQWAIDDGPVQITNIWKEPVGRTLQVIELMMKEEVCGFNLSHDSYHFHRTYNILSELPYDRPPTVQDYRDVEEESSLFDRSVCCRPAGVLDLLHTGRKGEFQSTLKQKDIVLKKFPKVLAPYVLRELQQKVEIPDIYFSRSKKIRGANWRIVELQRETFKEVSNADKFQEEDIDPDFVNIRLSFNPSSALKNIVEHITGEHQITIDEMRPLKKPEEYAYWPTFGGWLDVAREHIHAWTHDEERIKYAKNDVVDLRIVRDYLINRGHECRAGDDDSELAWAIGSIYWRGLSVDVEEAKRQLDTTTASLAESKVVNYNSPKKVLEYLHEPCDDMESLAIPDTKGETLESITKSDDWKRDNPDVYQRCDNVLRWRRLDKMRDLLLKLIRVKRFHIQAKVTGTKSNRMSGGSESFISSRGSINAQGIKHDTKIRTIFLLAPPGMDLSGGDFDGFEVSIAEAEYSDPELRKDLLGGKKIHGLFAAAMYELAYDYILEFSECGETEEKGWYARGKRGFFGRLYGAQIGKMVTVLWLEEDQVLKGLDRFFARYGGVKASQERTYEDHQALRQPDGIGTKIVWQEPKKYVESFLGFKRFFDLEYSICRTLFEMAQDLPDDMKRSGDKLRLIRRDRIQTGTGAACSAIYAAAFNIQSQIMRSAVNHKIQSPGGQLTKELQRRIWDHQPTGISSYLVLLLNVHDELMAPVDPSIKEAVKKTVEEFLEEKKAVVPLISMTWKTGMKNWSEK